MGTSDFLGIFSRSRLVLGNSNIRWSLPVSFKDSSRDSPVSWPVEVKNHNFCKLEERQRLLSSKSLRSPGSCVP